MRGRRNEFRDVKEPILERPFWGGILSSRLDRPFSKWKYHKRESLVEMMRTLEPRALKRLKGWPSSSVSGKKNLPEVRFGVKKRGRHD